MIKLSVKIHFQMLPELKSFSPSLGFTSCCWGRTWSRSVRPRSSRGPGPGSTRRSPGRRTHTCGGPAGRRRAHWTRTAVAVEAQKMEPVMLNRCVLSLNITEHRTETPTLLVDSSILRMGVGLCRRQRTDVSEAPLFDMSNRWLSVMPLPLSWGHRGSADVGGLSSGLKVIRDGVQVVQPVYSTHTGCTDVVILQPVGHIWSFHRPYRVRVRSIKTEIKKYLYHAHNTTAFILKGCGFFIDQGTDDARFSSRVVLVIHKGS